MITTKFIRAVVVVVVVGLVAVVALEVHWSLDAKHDARLAAGSAADAAADVMRSTHDSLTARHAAEVRAEVKKTHLVAFDIDGTGVVRVTVNARAKSYVLRHFGPTRSISEITVTAASPRSSKK